MWDSFFFFFCISMFRWVVCGHLSSLKTMFTLQSRVDVQKWLIFLSSVAASNEMKRNEMVLLRSKQSRALVNAWVIAARRSFFRYFHLSNPRCLHFIKWTWTNEIKSLSFEICGERRRFGLAVNVVVALKWWRDVNNNKNNVFAVLQF